MHQCLLLRIFVALVQSIHSGLVWWFHSSYTILKYTYSQLLHLTLHLNTLSREYAVSIAPRTENHANLLQILPYSFYNFFISSQQSLIFDIIKFNTSLYRFLLTFLKIVGYSSILFLVSYTWLHYVLSLTRKGIEYSLPSLIRPPLIRYP